jgi:predicted AAA+ superfamily ATPase
MLKGLYPRPYSQPVSSAEWYPDYIRTYVERDVRSLRNIEDLSLFRHFLALCAGRIGQLLNVTSLANDCGVTVATAKKWLSLLEASYLIYLLQPYHVNIGKRHIKTPKLYFYDTGLACSLLGIDTSEQLSTHYLRGGLFESLIITDLFKQAYARKIHPNIYFWRDKTGNEIDCLLSQSTRLVPIEIKAGKTFSQSFFKGIEEWYTLIESDEHNGVVVYAGDMTHSRSSGNVVGWKSAGTLFADVLLKK